VLARSDIAGVIIALPIQKQPEYIEAALKAGKHVFSEKPVGPDVESAKKLISWYRSIAEKNKVTWAVAEQFRFLPKHVWGVQNARKLGKVIGFNFRVFGLMDQGKLRNTIVPVLRHIADGPSVRQQVLQHRVAEGPNSQLRLHT
jgi:predicted dehydrogenase